jgi:hypothetical protein
LSPPSPWSIERRFDCVAADGNRTTATELYLGGVRQGPVVNADQIKVDAAGHAADLVGIRVPFNRRKPDEKRPAGLAVPPRRGGSVSAHMAEESEHLRAGL